MIEGKIKSIQAYHESLPLYPNSLATSSKFGFGNPVVCLRQVIMKVKSSVISVLEGIVALGQGCLLVVV